MANPSSIPTASLVLTLFSVLAFLTPTSTADENNLLLTGEVLGTDNQLSNLAASFVMQGDCNLVLYNKGSGFQSDTHGNGNNCTLTLNNRGQLIIRSSDGSTVWITPPRPKIGKYAAVLRPDGQVVIYGPSIWSTLHSHFNTEGLHDAELQTFPMLKNMLFSDQTLYNNTDQTLYNNAQLTTRDYTFVMREDCSLALVKTSVGDLWTSGTKGKGKHCFARLSHRGVLAVEDDSNKVLWASKPASKEGNYVLVLQINGKVVIYGPAVWSTASS